MDLSEFSPAVIGYLLTHTATVVDRQADQVLQERLGIGTSQFRILRTLQQAHHSQQRELADHLGQTEASISRQAKLLREKGFVSTQVNPKNKREHIMQLTPKGVQITEAAQEVMGQYFVPIFAKLTAKDQTQLRSSLQVLYDEVFRSDTCALDYYKQD